MPARGTGPEAGPLVMAQPAAETLPDAPAAANWTAALDQLGTIVLGKERQLRLAAACLLAGGHLLIEDRPGTGKTVLAHALAKTFGLEFRRVQFTSDLLPADIVGATIFDAKKASFTFHKGPAFTQVLLADEVNRATPKAQSALLEIMEERQVSVDGVTYPLPEPFFVIATQNPSDQHGTFPLPESQLDRFLMRIEMGYPGRDAELEIFSGTDRRALLDDLRPASSTAALLKLQREVEAVTASPALLAYLRDLLDYSRDSKNFRAGLSTRAGLALLRAAKAWALLHEESRVLPGHVQSVLPAVVGHRLTSWDSTAAHADMSQRLVDDVPVA